ncbi:VanZ family protein [bacterium]|nr:VanZ family protein [bacterium]
MDLETGKENLIIGANLARKLAFLCMLAISCALFLGRQISRLSSHLDTIIPALAVIAFVWILLHAKKTSFTTLRPRPIPLLAGAILLSFLLTKLVGLPIERIHIVKYMALGFSLFFCPSEVSQQKRFYFALFLSSFFGILEESLQYFIPERVFDERDILINVLSALTGVLFACGFTSKAPSLVSKPSSIQAITS